MTLTKVVRPCESSATLVEKQQIAFSKHVGRVGLTSFNGFMSNKAGSYGRDATGIAKYHTLEEPERSVTRCDTAKDRRTPHEASVVCLGGKMHCPFYIHNCVFEHPCSRKSYKDIEQLKGHIYRVHTSAEKCKNCQNLGAVPESKTLELSCTALNEEQICIGLFRNLSTRRYPLLSAETDIETWDIVYRTIFPDDQLIPSRFFPAPQSHSPEGGYGHGILNGSKQDNTLTLPIVEAASSSERKRRDGGKIVEIRTPRLIEEATKEIRDEIQDITLNERMLPPLVENASSGDESYEEKIVSEVVDKFMFMAGQELLNHLRVVMERPQPYEAPTRSQQDRETSTFASSYGLYGDKKGGRTYKRHREGGKDPGDEDGGSDGDDEDDDRKRGKKLKSSDGNLPRRRLRCPFYLNDPRKYGIYQACSSGMGFEDMARLKQHLKRAHTQPLRCERCQQEMKSKKDRAEHIRRTPPCPIMPSRDDRISREQWEDIDSTRDSSLKTIEEKYKHLYHTVFGAGEKSPNPYEKSFILSDMEEMLSAALDREFSNELVLTMDQIKGRIPAILQYCQEQIGQSENSEAMSDSFEASTIILTDRRGRSGDDKPHMTRNEPNNDEIPRTTGALEVSRPTLDTQVLAQEMELSASMSGAFTDPVLTPEESSGTQMSSYDSASTPSWDPIINQEGYFSSVQQTPTLSLAPSNPWTSGYTYDGENIPQPSFFPSTNPFSHGLETNETLDGGVHTLQQSGLNHTFTKFSASSAPYTQLQNRQPCNIEPLNSLNPFYQNINASTFPQPSNNNHSGYWLAPETFLSSYSTEQRTSNGKLFNDQVEAFNKQDNITIGNNIQHNPFLRSRDLGVGGQGVEQIPQRTKRSDYPVNTELDDYFKFLGS